MKQINARLVIFLYLLTGIGLAQAQTAERNLTGTITEAVSHDALPAATIYFPEIKKGALSDENGRYTITNIPASRLTIQVSLVGYQSFTQTIDIAHTSTFNIELEESVTEISEVVITGQAGAIEQKRTPAPIAVIPRTVLLESTATNIIDALAKQPGISQITTGSSISKPVIRGLGYNRVVVVNDGIRQEGQQWGDEHGIEIDEFGVNHVEILKGPASLAFGSDAMAGVINMLPAPTLPEGSIGGNIVNHYQANNGLWGYSANLAGNRHGFIWDGRISGKMAHDYQNSIDGFVANSRFRENAASLLAGINRNWGYSHLTLSYYELKPGIAGEGHDHGDEAEHADEAHDHHAYHPEAPFQKITHYKAAWNNKVFLGKGNIEATLGFQQNNRKEFESADEYGLYFKLNTLSYDLKYNLPLENDWTLTTGIGGMWQESANKGSEFLVPAYRLFDAGVFAIAHKRTGNFDFSGGLRADRRHLDSRALYLDANDQVTAAGAAGATERFAAFDQSFTGASGSLGMSYQVSRTTYTKLNVSRGFRAPSIAELGSNGNHEGTFRYEIGNPGLKPENSLQLDWGLGIASKHLSAEVNLFNNHVNNYIYGHKLQNAAGTDSLINQVPAFQFTGGKARLYGGEVFVDFHPHPLDFLHVQNTFSYTRGVLKNQPDTMRNLPMIPAARWISEVKLNAKKLNRFMGNAWMSFGIDHNLKQTKIFSAFNTETETPAYTLLNAGVGTDIMSRNGKLFSLYINCSNLTDKAYQSHLSRLKYAGHNDETGREGYYNTGRNVSVKLIIPINRTAAKTTK